MTRPPLRACGLDDQPQPDSADSCALMRCMSARLLVALLACLAVPASAPAQLQWDPNMTAGTGLLPIAATNTHTAGTNISGRILTVSADANLGTNPAATATNLSFNSGTLDVPVGFALGNHRGINMPNGGGGGTITVDSGTFA